MVKEWLRVKTTMNSFKFLIFILRLKTLCLET